MSKHMLVFATGLLVAGMATATNVFAGFEIEGNTLVFTDNDWYQVQTPDNFVTICNGASSCTVASGSYIVINHNTGERWERVEVPEGADDAIAVDDMGSTGTDIDAPAATTLGSLVIEGNLLSFSNNDWYQVQRPDDFQTVCEGVDSCLLENGTYIVINQTSGQRYEEVVIGATQSLMSDSTTTDSGGAGNDAVLEPLFDGTSIRWPDDGWYQVQNSADFSTVCEGGLSCDVSSGSYILINLSTGERLENINVVSGVASAVVDGGSGNVAANDAGDDSDTDTDANAGDNTGSAGEPVDDGFVPSPAPVVEGNTLVMSGPGWYQVQSATDFSTLCSGLLVCEVPRGVYNVINHTTGERFNNISVVDNSGMWFGTTSFGEGVFVIDGEGALYGLSTRADGLFEAVFGAVDGVARRYLHLPSRNPDHGTSFNLLGERPENINSFDMNDVTYNLTLNNEGQQLSNTGIGGNFSLTFATSDDVMPISLQSAAGLWQSRTAFCRSDCDITVVLDIAPSGFVTGTTQVNDNAQSQLAGSVATPGDSNQYLHIEYLLNGDRRAGVVYFDRFSDSLILNSIGVDNNIGSLSAIFQRN